MKKPFIEKIVEALADGAMESVDLFIAINKAGYGASRKRIEKKFREVEQRRIINRNKEELKRQKHSFYSLLSYLKKDGLIEKREGKWHITQLGKNKLRKSRNHAAYKSKQADTMKIVMFDIPEQERWKRAWLREALIGMGFQLVQKSVWAGKRKLPQEFLEDLREYKMLGYIDILTVTKSGSLRSFEI